MFGLAILAMAFVGICVSLVLGFLALIPWKVSGILVTASIGTSSLVFTRLALKQKEHSD